MITFHRVIRLAIVVMVLGGAAIAAPADISISNGWIRALPSQEPAGGYFTLHNDTDNDVVLTGASSPACGMLMLHKTDVMSGMAEMNDVESVTVPAHTAFNFEPGKYHLMCMMPTAAIHPGNSVPVTLQFAGGKRASAPFLVRNAIGQ